MLVLLYSSSKLGLSLMKSIIIEYSAFEIRCNILVLGFSIHRFGENYQTTKKKNKNLIPKGKIGNIKISQKL